MYYIYLKNIFFQFCFAIGAQLQAAPEELFITNHYCRHRWRAKEQRNDSGKCCYIYYKPRTSTLDNYGDQACSQPVFSGKPEGSFCLSCTFIFRNERNWMKKSARVLEKLVSLGLPGLQVATRLEILGNDPLTPPLKQNLHVTPNLTLTQT